MNEQPRDQDGRWPALPYGPWRDTLETMAGRLGGAWWFGESSPVTLILRQAPRAP